MISMTQVRTIRQLRKEGESITAIAEQVGVSRDTVYKYLKERDLSPQMPLGKPAHSIMDKYAPIIENWLDEDAKSWHKQRHSAKRIYERLRDEYNCTACESTVRHYVTKLKANRKAIKDQYLDLVWAPGEAQADFGEADFYVNGVRRRLAYFVLTFPFSNVGLAQVLPGQNAECVCLGLKTIFEYIGGVPKRVVFDNATGVGRKTVEEIRTTKLFGAFATHYCFDYTFCNPASGNEKGNVENKVGFIRRNLFVPINQILNVEAFNRRLLDKCMGSLIRPTG